jgi:hypothetical protein
MFDNNNELFMEPKTTQYGSHMVMTNVNKNTKTKLLNIDTIFRDEYNYNDNSYFNTTLPDKYKYNITIPERITNVKTMKIKSAEIPLTFYNIASNLGNNSFVLCVYYKSVLLNNLTVVVPDGHYPTIASLFTAINIIITPQNIQLGLNAENTVNFTLINPNFDSSTSQNAFNNFNIQFSSQDKYSFKNSLGWILGFRNTNYTIPPIEIDPNIFTYLALNSEKPTVTGVPAVTKYLYLAIDEFSKGVQNSFVTPAYNAFLTKNVIARISIDSTTYPYGSVLPANGFNGLLVSDNRNYNGKVDLQKLNIQLLNEFGMPIDLNNQDFSFCIEVTYE